MRLKNGVNLPFFRLFHRFYRFGDFRRVVRVIGENLRAGKIADMLEPPFDAPETFKSFLYFLRVYSAQKSARGCRQSVINVMPAERFQRNSFAFRSVNIKVERIFSSFLRYVGGVKIAFVAQAESHGVTSVVSRERTVVRVDNRFERPFKIIEIGRFKFVAILITVQMIGFGVQAHGVIRIEKIEILFILAHFAYEIFRSFHRAVAVFQIESAYMRRETLVCFVEHVSKHTRDGRFSVATAHAYLFGEIFGNYFQKFGAFQNVGLIFDGSFQFGIFLFYRVAIHNDVFPLDVFRRLSDINRNALFGEFFKVFARRDIASAHVEPYRQKITGERTHAHPAHADKMHV